MTLPRLSASAMVPQLQVESLGRIEYEKALALQEDRVALKLSGDERDYLLVLEHEPVYTLGRGAKAEDLLDAPARLGVPCFRVGRGGGATFHGPGQLVSYPIITLARHGRDVHRYVRRLEDVLMAVCRGFGVAADRRDGVTGVWVEDRKIASIGVGVRRWVTFHGTALNVCPDLSYFDAIVPCGMPALRTTSLVRELDRPLTLTAVAEAFSSEFRRCFCFTDPQLEP